MRIQAHVANYMGMFVISTGFAYLVSFSFGKTEEEKLRELVSVFHISRSIFMSWFVTINCFSEPRSKILHDIHVEGEISGKNSKNVEHRQHLQKFFDDLKDESKKDLMEKKLDGLHLIHY